MRRVPYHRIIFRGSSHLLLDLLFTKPCWFELVKLSSFISHLGSQCSLNCLCLYWNVILLIFNGRINSYQQNCPTKMNTIHYTSVPRIHTQRKMYSEYHITYRSPPTSRLFIGVHLFLAMHCPCRRWAEDPVCSMTFDRSIWYQITNKFPSLEQNKTLLIMQQEIKNIKVKVKHYARYYARKTI